MDQLPNTTDRDREIENIKGDIDREELKIDQVIESIKKTRDKFAILGIDYGPEADALLARCEANKTRLIADIKARLAAVEAGIAEDKAIEKEDAELKEELAQGFIFCVGCEYTDVPSDGAEWFIKFSNDFDAINTAIDAAYTKDPTGEKVAIIKIDGNDTAELGFTKVMIALEERSRQQLPPFTRDEARALLKESGIEGDDFLEIVEGMRPDPTTLH
jgi:hypothetical protein